MPYRQLVIPCCSRCNEEHLSRIEQEIQQACERGSDAVRALSPMTVFLWLGKIYYGLLYKELTIPRDRRSRSEAAIVSRSTLEQFKLHHFFLQAARSPYVFHGFPASIFIHDVQRQKDVRRQFNFRDSHHYLAISILLGGTGIIGILQDAGVCDIAYGEMHQKYEGRILHPIQFAELTARAFYSASSITRAPRYTLAEHEGQFTVVQHPPRGQVFGRWDPEHYAFVLAEHTGQPMEDLFVPPASVKTFLDRSDGSFFEIDVENEPWP